MSASNSPTLRTVSISVPKLVQRLQDKRAAIETDAAAKLATVDAAIATVSAPGWVASQRAEYVNRLAALVKSGAYDVDGSGNIHRVNPNADALGASPTFDIDGMVSRLETEREAIERDRENAFAQLDAEIETYELTNEFGSDGSITVELGFDPTSAFRGLAVRALGSDAAKYGKGSKSAAK